MPKTYLQKLAVFTIWSAITHRSYLSEWRWVKLENVSRVIAVFNAMLILLIYLNLILWLFWIEIVTTTKGSSHLKVYDVNQEDTECIIRNPSSDESILKIFVSPFRFIARLFFLFWQWPDLRIYIEDKMFSFSSYRQTIKVWKLRQWQTLIKSSFLTSKIKRHRLSWHLISRSVN